MPSIAKKKEKGERNNKSSHRIIFKSGKIQQPTHCIAGQGLFHDIYAQYIYHVCSVCSGLVWYSGKQRPETKPRPSPEMNHGATDWGH